MFIDKSALGVCMTRSDNMIVSYKRFAVGKASKYLLLT